MIIYREMLMAIRQKGQTVGFRHIRKWGVYYGELCILQTRNRA